MYDTIEECQKEVYRFSKQIDIQYGSVCSLLKYIKNIFSIIVMPLFYAAVALDAVYYLKYFDIRKDLLLVINIIAIAFLLSRYLLISSAEKSLNNDYIQAKIEMCSECFQKYKGFNELADSEKSKVFEKDICNLIGLRKVK